MASKGGDGEGNMGYIYTARGHLYVDISNFKAWSIIFYFILLRFILSLPDVLLN